MSPIKKSRVKPRPGQKPSRPGQKPSRPGQKPPRPGATASRPGQKPPRPGAAASRPGQKPPAPGAKTTKGAKGPVRRKGVAKSAIKIDWSGFRPMYDYWGNEIQRYYQLETLASATEHFIRTRDYFIAASIQQTLGTAPITSMHFTLFQEGRFQLIFQLRAANANKKSGLFSFVVAKNSELCSKVAFEEHQHLRTIYARNSEDVVEPLRGGNIFLPDRHRRTSHGRDIYVYLTRWLKGFDELGVNKQLQFIINVEKHHTFTIAQTLDLKRQIITCMLRTYDPVQRNCMAIPEIASGDFVVRMGKTGHTQAKLIACRKMLNKATPSAVIRKIVTAHWPWGRETLFLRPGDPDYLAQALIEVWGKAETARALPLVLGRVRRPDVEEDTWDYVQALQACVLERSQG